MPGLGRLESEGALRREPASLRPLTEELGVEQSVLSHHLSHLREARLVVGERDGRRVVYRLHDAHVGHMVEETPGHADEDSA